MKIIAILFPVFSLVLVGYLYGRRHRPDMDVANRMVLIVFLPALVFDVMSAQGFAIYSYRWLLLGGLLVVLGSGLIAWPVARWFGISWRAFVPTMMFNNCGNLGIPLAVLTFGNDALQGAVVLLLISNLIHFTLGIYLFGGAVSWKGLAANPVNIAMALGLLVNVTGTEIPPFLLQPISMLGQIVIPLMLFSLGVRMLNVRFEHWKVGLIGAVVCPLSGLLVVPFILPFLPLDSLQYGLLILFAALPPAVLNFLLAEQYRQQPDLVASMVLLGNASAVLTLSAVLWWLI